ncbi:TIGR03986 family type III CRISPR-associated RAMP protein [Paenibacillus senegalimassiliensis]|uniref:TIGR03986 family type III CRISPR-associated RAMP protein n=1 Tax=Paenibacillus senegalimassiliensis TaxID=1737426 RepID=UPI00073E1CF0|nr:TIGR03986 family CRISPR-associated RAMP protein [Paenibacillus senegalimassiliensis]
MKGRSNNQKLIEVTLPYDFISLPGERGKPNYYYPYHSQNEAKRPPRHDLHEADHLSGYISYRINPCSPLVLELRETSETGAPAEYWLSGSQIRGKLRSNVEVLSASYPDFVDDSEMLYRRIAGGAKGERYKQKLGITDGNGLEQVIEAGYLYQDHDGSYYIIPAVMIGDKHFVSVKELDIVNMNSNVLPEANRLFKWSERVKSKGTNGTMLDVMNNLNSQVKKFDDEIRNLRKSLEIDPDHPISEKIKKVFTNDFNFTKVGSRNKQEKVNIEKLKKELLSELRNKLKQYNIEQQLEELFAKLIERWALKAEMYCIYEHRSVKKNSTPYEKRVKYVPAGKGVSCIEHASSTIAGGIDGVLINSTNVGSKRAHYLIGKEREDAVRIDISDSLIISYNKAFKRIHLKTGDKDKQYYNLFIKEGTPNTEPQVIFYQLKKEDDSPNVLTAVGRTPYFKIPYDYQLDELLGEENEDGVDFANALFGYIPRNNGKAVNEEKSAYKSRLRFSPLRVYGDIHGEEKEFLLAKPQASAGAMYLKSDGKKMPTYEKPVDSENGKSNNNLRDPLRGVKYYHVLPKTIQTIPQGTKGSEINSIRQVYDPLHSAFHLEGKIYFKNLTDAELGLLLLAMDVSLLSDVEKYNSKGKPHYELIGGAKAYGYGKVQFELIEIMLEQSGNTFESLVITPFRAVEAELSVFVDTFINMMKSEFGLEQIDIKGYVQSKLEREFDSAENYVNWSNMSEKRKKPGSNNKGGGYPTNWILKSEED